MAQNSVVTDGDPSRYGCFNREPFRESLTVQDGWDDDSIGVCAFVIQAILHFLRLPITLDCFNQQARIARLKTIPFRNSMDCQFSKDTPDTRCAGCKWNQQEAK